MLVPAWDRRTGRRYDVTLGAFAIDPNLAAGPPTAAAKPPRRKARPAKPSRRPARATTPDASGTTETPATGGEE